MEGWRWRCVGKSHEIWSLCKALLQVRTPGSVSTTKVGFLFRFTSIHRGRDLGSSHSFPLFWASQTSLCETETGSWSDKVIKNWVSPYLRHNAGKDMEKVTQPSVSSKLSSCWWFFNLQLWLRVGLIVVDLISNSFQHLNAWRMPQNSTADEKQVIYLYIFVDCFVHFLKAENMLGVLFANMSCKSFNIQRRKLLRLFMASQDQW